MASLETYLSRANMPIRDYYTAGEILHLMHEGGKSISRQRLHVILETWEDRQAKGLPYLPAIRHDLVDGSVMWLVRKADWNHHKKKMLAPWKSGKPSEG